jgi:hypothetical protein
MNTTKITLQKEKHGYSAEVEFAKGHRIEKISKTGSLDALFEQVEAVLVRNRKLARGFGIELKWVCGFNPNPSAAEWIQIRAISKLIARTFSQ